MQKHKITFVVDDDGLSCLFRTLDLSSLESLSVHTEGQEAPTLPTSIIPTKARRTIVQREKGQRFVDRTATASQRALELISTGPVKRSEVKAMLVEAGFAASTTGPCLSDLVRAGKARRTGPSRPVDDQVWELVP